MSNNEWIEEEYRGPTTTSSWVLPGKLLYGAYPGCFGREPEHSELVRSVLAAGVTDIVSLLEDEEQLRCHDYRADYTAAAVEHGRRPHVGFHSFPIPDLGTVDDAPMRRLIDTVFELLLPADACVLVHCYGGHGRSGVVAATVLGVALGLPPQPALARLQRIHRLRPHRGDWDSPQTDAQRQQVVRLIDAYQHHPHYWRLFSLD